MGKVRWSERLMEFRQLWLSGYLFGQNCQNWDQTSLTHGTSLGPSFQWKSGARIGLYQSQTSRRIRGTFARDSYVPT